MPIRRGDGTGLTPNGYQEVRLGDGSVLWSGGPAETIVDSWEDQDYAEYDLESSGTTADFGFNTTNTKHGGVAAELSGNTSYPKILSTSGLDNYPAPGDHFEIWKYNSIGTTSASNCQFGMYFGGVDLSNLYYTRQRVDDSTMQLMVKSGGTDSGVDTATTSLDAGWYRWDIEWDDGSTFGGADGDFSITCEDEAGATMFTLAGNDTTFGQGAFGIWGGIENGEHILWDGCRILNR